MARRTEFYKGRRKRRNYAIIPSIIIVGLITLIVVLFYGMQKYAVITKEGVSIELPILNEGKTTIDAQGNEVKVFAPVDSSASNKSLTIAWRSSIVILLSSLRVARSECSPKVERLSKYRYRLRHTAQE